MDECHHVTVTGVAALDASTKSEPHAYTTVVINNFRFIARTYYRGSGAGLVRSNYTLHVYRLKELKLKIKHVISM